MANDETERAVEIGTIVTREEPDGPVGAFTIRPVDTGRDAMKPRTNNTGKPKPAPKPNR